DLEGVLEAIAQGAQGVILRLRRQRLEQQEGALGLVEHLLELGDDVGAGILRTVARGHGVGLTKGGGKDGRFCRLMDSSRKIWRTDENASRAGMRLLAASTILSWARRRLASVARAARLLCAR